MVLPLCYNMLVTNCIKKPWSDFILFIFIFVQHKSGEARVSCYCRVNCYCVHVYSYFEKGCRKKCTRQSRKALWVVLSSLFFKEI